jgi:DNA polymerase-4
MEKATKLHIDINSCFATIEQLSNPLLQGKPVAVAAYNSDNGVILAASKEAKKMGIKTGFRISEAKKIYPEIVILEPDVNKYRYIHQRLKRILKKYSPAVVAKSIDEFAVDFKGIDKNLMEMGKEIKKEIAKNIGEWLTVSIGIGPNRFLAKTASNMVKPDGLVEINENNFLNIYSKLKLMDLNGINWRTELRLRINGIETVTEFFLASRQKLKSVFCSVLGDYWYFRLRGIEVDGKKEEMKKSYNNIFSLKNRAKTIDELKPIIYQLCQKSGRKLRAKKRMATGVAVWLQFLNGDYHRVKRKPSGMVNGMEIFEEAVRLLPKELKGEVRRVAIYIFALKSARWVQDDLFGSREKSLRLIETADLINDKFGTETIKIGTLLAKNKMPEFIGFGQTR